MCVCVCVVLLWLVLWVTGLAVSAYGRPVAELGIVPYSRGVKGRGERVIDQLRLSYNPTVGPPYRSVKDAVIRDVVGIPHQCADGSGHHRSVSQSVATRSL